ncbi:Calcium-independent phospholipase A2-gamma OS=Homo sapiens GN=PNPLA8 PE=1 SV=1 [Rhizoctonia solani AG-1 IB]|uniref:Calcium-independent phospholipase A2-gamma n=1 Tax=Thanatephorus cucumeris (strain AG1-IB / isolate 7/3/14) TaxID=1108050 RepID=A0A0B7FRT7_THACB|nr:Calcium-independent phospholipase A2-gamma OS=Homo sapiens GN=PNPLA8 PE=1 SV=1 [Rhizoctonia solani AG-1 IB]
MSQSSTSNRGLNILSIDGGGVRGLSALVLLEELMRRIQHLEGLDSPPRPHQYFDLIAGTGTGAVQACMLARLRMPVDLAIESYANLAKEVFSERKWFGSGTFKATKLKDSLTRITRNTTGNPDEPLIESRPTGTYCKTLVFAMSGHNMRAGIPIAFRSYPAASSQGPECTIWETLCATMAHPELFKSFEIGGSLLKQSFIDAGLGCNNPLSHILAEVKTLYPERQVASVISIGTGHTRTIRIPDRSTMRQLLPTATIQAMKGIAEDAEKVAEDMARRFRSTSGVYFRLSVDQGMQSVEMDRWDQLSEVAEHTRAYMRTLDVKQSIDKAAEAIHLRTQSVPTVQLDGEIRLSTTTVTASYVSRSCPAPTPMFAGCDLRLRRTESGITGSEKERKVCILHGLGGAGKTQTALKVVERTRSSWNEVVYADASTRESIETALRDVAIAKDIGDTYQSTLQWLESHREPWLLVLDNADDPSLPIRDYMPGGDHGSVIITTRLSGMVSLARGTDSNCSISSMDPDDALMLLLKCARRQDRELPHKELADAKELLQASTYTCSTTFVNTGCRISDTLHSQFHMLDRSLDNPLTCQSPNTGSCSWTNSRKH